MGTESLALPGLLEEINSVADLDGVAEVLFRNLRQVLPYDRIGIAAIRPDEDCAELLAVRSSMPVHLKPGYRERLSGSSLERLRNGAKLRILNDLEEYLRRKPESASTRLILREGMRSSLTVPLVVRDRPFGFLFFSSRSPGAYSEEHLPYAKSAADLVAPSTEKALLLRELRNKTEILDLILEYSPAAIGFVDAEDRIRSWNPAAARLFGYSKEEILGRPYGILRPTRIPRSKHAIASAHEHEVEMRSKTGEVRMVAESAREVRSGEGKPIGRCMIWRDLTELKRLQADLLEAQVLASVGELAASVAHEVKNPLAGISGAVQILKRSFAEGDSRRELLERVIQQVDRLDRLVRDLLSFAKPWKARPREQELARIVRSVVEGIQPKGAKARATILCQVDGTRLVCDPELMEIALWNVVANAVEAVPRGGHVWVTAGTKGGRVRIRVEDDGPGIPAKHLGAVFRPFFTTKAKGTGLGLSIVRKAVTAHNGMIRIEPREGGGTRVELEFPIRSESHGERQNPGG